MSCRGIRSTDWIEVVVPASRYVGLLRPKGKIFLPLTRGRARRAASSKCSGIQAIPTNMRCFQRPMGRLSETTTGST
jgi:hypothetical protein